MFRMLIKLLRNMGIIKENSSTVNMCKGTEGIYNDGVECGIEQGIEQGIELGREQGIEQGREQLIINAMKSGSTAEEIALALKIDLTYVLSLKEEMKK